MARLARQRLKEEGFAKRERRAMELKERYPEREPKPIENKSQLSGCSAVFTALLL